MERTGPPWRRMYHFETGAEAVEWLYSPEGAGWHRTTWLTRLRCLIFGHAPRGRWKPECLRCGKESA